MGFSSWEISQVARVVRRKENAIEIGSEKGGLRQTPSLMGIYYFFHGVYRQNPGDIQRGIQCTRGYGNEELFLTTPAH